MVAALLLALAAALLGAPAAAQSAYKKSYVSDMEAFLGEVQQSYPFFDLKEIRQDWRATVDRLEKEAKRCKKDADFMALIAEGLAGLRDAHLAITRCAVELPPAEPRFWPGVALMPASADRVVVMVPPAGQGDGDLAIGTIVLAIDGRDARQVLEERAEAAWRAGGPFSSPQRARLFEYRLALRGARGDKHVLEVLDEGGKKKKVSVACREEASGWAHAYNLPEGLVQAGDSCFFGRLPSGAGYLWLRRIDDGAVAGFVQALATHPDARGWIVDLRGNGGGGYGEELLAQVKALPRPVAILLDAGCISAGETLARDLITLAGARSFGETSAGASSAKREWSFPSGIATIRFSTRSRSGPGGTPLEFHGIVPDVLVEAVPEEAQAGRNSAILRAEEYLQSGS